MYLQLVAFMRDKLKIVLSIIIFTILIIALTFVLNKYEMVKYQLNKDVNKSNDFSLTLLIDNDDFEKLNSIDHIKEINYIRLSDNSLKVTLLASSNDTLSYVKNEIVKLGFSYSDNNDSSDEVDSYKALNLLLNVIFFVIIIVFAVVIFIEIKTIIKNDEIYLKILYILGYKLKKIWVIILIKIAIIITLSILISLILTFIYTNLFDIKNLELYLIYSTIIVLIIYILYAFILFFKIKKLIL